LLVLLSFLISRLIIRSGLRIFHSKVFSFDRSIFQVLLCRHINNFSSFTNVWWREFDFIRYLFKFLSSSTNFRIIFIVKFLHHFFAKFFHCLFAKQIEAKFRERRKCIFAKNAKRFFLFAGNPSLTLNTYCLSFSFNVAVELQIPILKRFFFNMNNVTLKCCW